jgi:hypothetical protein
MQTDFFLIQHLKFNIQHLIPMYRDKIQHFLTSHVIKLKRNVKIMTPYSRHGIL